MNINTTQDEKQIDVLDNLEKLLSELTYRLDWNKYFMGLALWAKQRSACERLKVGCVIVKDKRLICMGYNGFLPNAPHKSRVRNNHEQATVHAEQNAIADCAKRGVSCDGCTAYVTHYPCIHCFKIMAASGIKKINYINDYRNDKNVDKLSHLSNIIISKISS